MSWVVPKVLVVTEEILRSESLIICTYFWNVHPEAWGFYHPIWRVFQHGWKKKRQLDESRRIANLAGCKIWHSKIYFLSSNRGRLLPFWFTRGQMAKHMFKRNGVLRAMAKGVGNCEKDSRKRCVISQILPVKWKQWTASGKIMAPTTGMISGIVT